MTINRTVGLLSTMSLLSSCELDPAGQTDLAITAAEFSKTSKQSVKGQVERDFGHALERYSFHAHCLGNGAIGGRFHLRDMFADGTEDITVHGRITCFTIEADRKTARLGGVIQSASQDQFVVTFAASTVRDNGNSKWGFRWKDLGRSARAPGT